MPTLPVDGRICLQTHVESQTISPHLPEIVHPLLAPLYALFDRTEPGANHAHGPNAPVFGVVQCYRTISNEINHWLDLHPPFPLINSHLFGSARQRPLSVGLDPLGSPALPNRQKA